MCLLAQIPAAAGALEEIAHIHLTPSGHKVEFTNFCLFRPKSKMQILASGMSQEDFNTLVLTTSVTPGGVVAYEDNGNFSGIPGKTVFFGFMR